VEAINALQNGAAILDGIGNPILPVPILGILKIPMRFGSQHQKMLCVSGDDGLICFCGGIDFNPDRLSNTGKGAPLHDVHCRIRGPGASDLLTTFVQRWNDHPQGRFLNRPPNPNKGKDFLGNLPPPGGKGPLIVNVPAAATPGPQMVRIGRTFKTGLYGFAPAGEFTAADVISSAIRNARRFIHTEDQYFVGNKRLEDALVASLADGLKHLTVVLTHFKISDLLRVHEHRRIFINRLKRTGGDRVRIFFRDPGGFGKAFDDGKVDHTYVHAKTWVMDDEFAVIGSVNSNNRSWTHDTEVCAGIYDITGNNQILNYHLAHKLRIELWQEHLGMQGDVGAAELWDGVASGVHWLKNNRPPGAQVQDYDVNEPGDHFFIPAIPIAGIINSEMVYDTFCDPA
jgi:phosphatidylserine/phosphatidylglycerophosphate/cardiolipin synthase-like enzyme